jgi:hypothetical protein
MKDVEQMALKIANKMGVEVLSISIHRDEGKDAENINYHAHILFNYYNFDRHKITHHNANERIMQQVQDIVANELRMERGISKEISRKKHIPHNEYRHIAKEQENKERGQIKTVGELKQKLDELQAEIRAKNNALEEGEKLYSKTDYDAINALKRKLKKDTFLQVVESYYILEADLARKPAEIEEARKATIEEGTALARKAVVDCGENPGKLNFRGVLNFFVKRVKELTAVVAAQVAKITELTAVIKEQAEQITELTTAQAEKAKQAKIAEQEQAKVSELTTEQKEAAELKEAFVNVFKDLEEAEISTHATIKL